MASLASFPLSGTIWIGMVPLRTVPLDLACVFIADRTLTWWVCRMCKCCAVCIVLHTATMPCHCFVQVKNISFS